MGYLGVESRVRSRDAAPSLRLNVKRIVPDDLRHYLESIGWTGDLAAAVEMMGCLYPIADRVTVCLEVGAQVCPSIGFECAFKKQSPDEPGWNVLLNELARRGLCTTGKRDVLNRWPGYTTPANAANSWPSSLLAGGLLQAADKFSAFAKKLSHINVVLHPHTPAIGKGYLWFEHVWLRHSPLSATGQGCQQQQRQPVATGNNALDQLAAVRTYYDQMTGVYIENLGHTIQATLIGDELTEENEKVHNLRLAARAGAQAGQRILDAGCGVCGPAVDIASVLDVTIAGVTISPVQAGIARDRIVEAGLEHRVYVQIADYHVLPFPSSTFETALFFESAGYSYDQRLLFSEAYRVLKTNGILYIKDVFKREDPLEDAEKHEMAIFDRIYAQRTTSMSETVDAIRAAGFSSIETHDLRENVSGKRWEQATYDLRPNGAKRTPFGDVHGYPFRCLPILIGEVRAYKSGATDSE